MEIFDRNIQILLHVDLRKEYRKSKIYSLFGLVTTTITATAIFIYASYKARRFFTFKSLGTFIGYTFPYLIMSFINLQFCTLLLCLKQRFGWLNQKTTIITKRLEHTLRTYEFIHNFFENENRLHLINM